MGLLYHSGADPTRVYFGTDTHAMAYGSAPRWLGYCRFSDMSMGEPMNRG